MSVSIHYDAKALAGAANIIGRGVLDLRKECFESRLSGQTLRSIQDRVDQFRQEIAALEVQVNQAESNTFISKQYSVRGMQKQFAILAFARIFREIRDTNLSILNECQNRIQKLSS